MKCQARLLSLEAVTLLVMAIAQGALPGLVSSAAAASSTDACTPPIAITGSIQQTAWRLLVAATCPVNSNKYPYVVWENWIEQAQLYPSNPADGLTVPNSGAGTPTHKLHGSPLAFANNPGLIGSPDTNCNPATIPPSNNPNLVVCEEVRINGATEDYIAGRGFWNRSNQQAIPAASGTFEFPKPAVEVKADWEVLSSCNSVPTGVHVEQIGDTCYAMAGIAIISKLKENWIWATWEPQNLDTNPNRCVVLGCKDPYGSSPVKTNGGPNGNTQLTSALKTLMQQGALAPEWFNYRLDGVQTTFVDANGKSTLLGNSVIEGENAGVPLGQSSCISCHAVSSIKSDGTDGITLLNSNPVGRPVALPSSAWVQRDFVWSLSEACANSPFQTCTSN
jgi:hypothetical protein